MEPETVTPRMFAEDAIRNLHESRDENAYRTQRRELMGNATAQFPPCIAREIHDAIPDTLADFHNTVGM